MYVHIHCCGLTQQVAEHHTVVHSLPLFPVGWGKESEKKKIKKERKNRCIRLNITVFSRNQRCSSKKHGIVDNVGSR